jgi:hypothetical protein
LYHLAARNIMDLFSVYFVYGAMCFCKSSNFADSFCARLFYQNSYCHLIFVDADMRYYFDWKISFLVVNFSIIPVVMHNSLNEARRLSLSYSTV